MRHLYTARRSDLLEGDVGSEEDEQDEGSNKEGKHCAVDGRNL